MNSNYTRTKILNQETGEISDERYDQTSKRYYFGPRKYWRTMELYDSAQLLIPSKVGVQLMIYFKRQVDTSNYRIQINNTWLAKDIGTNRETVSRNLTKLAKAGFIIKETRGMYFVSPSMFWVGGMDDEIWQELKKQFNEKLDDLGITHPRAH